MDSITFTIPGEPKAKGRPRFNTRTGRAYTPKNTVLYEALVKMEYYRQCNNHKFDDDALINMEITAYFQVAKSDSKKKKKMKLDNIIRPTKKPDMDNIIKVIADPLNSIAYHDDSQIVDCSIKKMFSEHPRVEVTISQINGNNN